MKFVDVNGDGSIRRGDQVYLGSALPEISGGIVSELKWKGFDLNFHEHTNWDVICIILFPEVQLFLITTDWNPYLDGYTKCHFLGTTGR